MTDGRRTVRVVAGVVLREGRILATQRAAGEMRGGWEFPGGKIEPGETPQEALARELMEELSLGVQVCEKLCTVEHDYPSFHLSMDCYWCRPVTGLVLREHSDARWLRPRELQEVAWLPADRIVAEAAARALAGKETD